ncbi:hypothetical protein H4J02_06570 [Protaetiibacter sp. SSC-01]|uniref:hypothetical protein n=1 Tax=Protaetiibacter sp. SSC-01 TaxID=2759943 RepID=UPI0016570308|nr:hypothetical protein [Protaetiibacter sp. SSC-01]QNO38650.1 hypothetical protein H4J02_06570 [Protaetiibacter sp. SSC-01]
MRRAIEARDAATILRLIRERVHEDPAGCWIWRRVSPQGYPAVSRDPSVPVHRLVVWATRMGCKSELSALPPVHHTCARTACVNPDHLVPVSSAFNSLEALARKAALSRIEALTRALEQAAPDHPVLKEWPEIELLPLGQLIQERRRRPASMSSALLQRKQREAEHARHRFAQVAEANKLLEQGLTRREVAQRLAIGVATLDAWRRKVAEASRAPEDAVVSDAA